MKNNHRYRGLRIVIVVTKIPKCPGCSANALPHHLAQHIVPKAHWDLHYLGRTVLLFSQPSPAPTTDSNPPKWRCGLQNLNRHKNKKTSLLSIMNPSTSPRPASAVMLFAWTFQNAGGRVSFGIIFWKLKSMADPVYKYAAQKEGHTFPCVGMANYRNSVQINPTTGLPCTQSHQLAWQ